MEISRKGSIYFEMQEVVHDYDIVGHPQCEFHFGVAFPFHKVEGSEGLPPPPRLFHQSLDPDSDGGAFSPHPPSIRIPRNILSNHSENHLSITGVRSWSILPFSML